MSDVKAWINLSPNIQQGVEVINKIDGKKYQLLLSRIVQEMLTNPDSYKPFTDEEEEKLLVSLSVDKQELHLLIYTSIVILNQVIYNTPAVDTLYTGLLESLKLTEDKSLIFTNVWKNNSKKLYLQLKQKLIYTKKLEDVSWLVNIETSSQNKHEKFIPKAVLQFKLKDNHGSSNITIDATENQLIDLYKVLEDIQESLDALA